MYVLNFNNFLLKVTLFIMKKQGYFAYPSTADQFIEYNPDQLTAFAGFDPVAASKDQIYRFGWNFNYLFSFYYY